MVFPGDDYVYAFRGDGSNAFWRFLAAPPKYELVASAGDITTRAVMLLDAPSATVLSWLFE